MMVECGICLEQYQEGEIELHRKICVLWLMFRCNICSEDYVNKEGLWNHLDLHEISDESKEAYYREIKAKHRFHECLLCNDKRAYSKCLYDNHVHDVHNGLFLQCSDSRENFRSEQVKNEHAFDQCKVRDQTLASGVYVDQATFNVENKDSEAKHLEAANTELKMEIKVEDTVLQEQKYQLSNEEKGHSSLMDFSYLNGMDDDQLLLQAVKAVAEVVRDDILEASKEEVKKRPRKRSCWTTDWLLKRPAEGACTKLLVEWERGLPVERKLYDDFRRMNEQNFSYLLEKAGPLIQKQDTTMRKAISSDIRLNATLYYLATGESFQSLRMIFRVSKSALHRIVPETAKAIYQALAPEYLKVPSSEAEWLQIAERYEKVWNVPNCIGSLDGKHIKINVPPNAGSAYFNYKHFHSIILMAMCDADYRFTYIDAGANGRECDGGYFNNSSLSRCLADASLNLPPAKPLPGRNIAVPYVLLADDAFALKPYILKPFPGRALSVSKRLANYRMSRGRRTIENAFGIMSMRYRVLRTHLFDADKTKHITKAICVLHNFHIMRNDPTYAPRLADSCNTQTGEIVEGAWRIEDMNFGCGLRRQSDRDRELNAIEVRNEFMAYFNEEGQVPWQLQSVGMADWNGDD